MNKLILSLFNKAIPTTNTKSFNSINEVGMKVGYFVHPSLCNKEVYDWLTSLSIDYNSTFYKRWQDITGKSRFELLIDQIRHYASTYGTEFKGEQYLPEGTIELPEIYKFKVITPITKEEVISRCEKMLYSGIALKQETMEAVLSILDSLNHVVDIELVKNKEAKMKLCVSMNKLPSDPVDMVRLMSYRATTKTLLIKDNSTIKTIKETRLDLSKEVNAYGIDKLAEVFHRFKPIFLAFKKTPQNKAWVNRLRKSSDKNHKPYKAGYFENILSSELNEKELKERLTSLNNFKKVTLLQTINIRLKELKMQVYLIRNQKIHIGSDTKKINETKLQTIYAIIYESLVSSLSAKQCKIKLPTSINLTLPTSEKSFIGNYPLGTSFDFSDSHNIVGIHWKGEDGARDIDLKMIALDGKTYGWNAAYTDSKNNVVYSGDMTYADPEATELFYTKKGFSPMIVKANLFSGAIGSKFKFFLAKEKIDRMHSNYMVNPDNIVINVDCVMDSREKTLGVITENKFILAQFRSGNTAVSRFDATTKYTDYALRTLDCFIPLNTLLIDAGFEIVTEDADIDLTDLSKDSLMSLIS